MKTLNFQVEDEVYDDLAKRAHALGISVEEEARYRMRKILKNYNLAEELLRFNARLGADGEEIPLPPRDEPARVAEFG